jgi:hypothetical protein
VSDSAFLAACQSLEDLLSSECRLETVAAAARLAPLGKSLRHLAAGMRVHHWRAGTKTVDLADLIETLDQATRREGFHVLHDWDGKAARVTPNSIAVDVVEFTAAQAGTQAPQPAVLAVLLDYYFMYVLALVAIRAWDTDDPGASLDRVSGLLQLLQGANGSGQRFADNAETLLLIATSHYEPNEHGYDLLLGRGRALPHRNRVAMALGHAQAMGSHLRFGYEVTYGKDLTAMREDNVADYPWLCFALAGLFDEFRRLRDAGDTGESRDRVIEGIANALSPDPDAFLGRPPASLNAHGVDLSRVHAGLEEFRTELAGSIALHRPLDRGYSPLALFFNFSQNVLKGTVADAVLRGAAWTLSLNDLFTGVPKTDPRAEAKLRLTRTLGAYARANPDTIRGRLSPVIVYDPIVGRQYFGQLMRSLRA